jgi:dTDP-6-deoxy-L-talose 4-dehydrogenase (NAD+)
MASLICDIATRSDFDGIVNCCSGRPISVLDLVRQHLRERGATIELNTGHYPYPDYEPHAFWGDRTRLDSILGKQSQRILLR